MSANRVQKARSSATRRKTRSELALSAFVAFNGHPAEMPCSSCFRGKRKCVIADGASRCSECIRRKVFCDGLNFADSREFFRSQLQPP
jgi:hypothetical protein